MNLEAIFWFRRDLRLRDNHGLFTALTQHSSVLPIFIFDSEILEKLPKNDARVSFIYQRLKTLNKSLDTNRKIQTFYGTPKEIFTRLITDHAIKAVYTNHDYEPYATNRDLVIKNILNQKRIKFKTLKDQVIFEKSEVTKDDGSPYKVYTPYMYCPT